MSRNSSMVRSPGASCRQTKAAGAASLIPDASSTASRIWSASPREAAPSRFASLPARASGTPRRYPHPYQAARRRRSRRTAPPRRSESRRTTHQYLEADLAAKEAVLQRLDDPAPAKTRFRPCPRPLPLFSPSCGRSAQARSQVSRPPTQLNGRPFRSMLRPNLRHHPYSTVPQLLRVVPRSSRHDPILPKRRSLRQTRGDSHRHDRDRRRDHRPLRIPLVHRSLASTTGKTSPASAKPRTGSKRPFNAASPSHSWPRPSPSCGTPQTPTPKRKSPNAAETPPGTPPKPTRPPWTCSTPCATRSPSTELTPQPQVTPHPNKTRTSRSAPNGLPHNSESRDQLNPRDTVPAVDQPTLLRRPLQPLRVSV